MTGQPEDGDDPPPPPQQQQPRGHKHYNHAERVKKHSYMDNEDTKKRCACIAGGIQCLKHDKPIKMYFIGRRGYYCRGCAVAGSCECKCGPCEDGRFAAQWQGQGDQRTDTSSTSPNLMKEDKQIGQGGKGGGNEDT